MCRYEGAPLRAAAVRGVAPAPAASKDPPTRAPRVRRLCFAAARRALPARRGLCVRCLLLPRLKAPLLVSPLLVSRGSGSGPDLRRTRSAPQALALTAALFVGRLCSLLVAARVPAAPLRATRRCERDVAFARVPYGTVFLAALKARDSDGRALCDQAGGGTPPRARSSSRCACASTCSI